MIELNWWFRYGHCSIRYNASNPSSFGQKPGGRIPSGFYTEDSHFFIVLLVAMGDLVFLVGSVG